MFLFFFSTQVKIYFINSKDKKEDVILNTGTSNVELQSLRRFFAILSGLDKVKYFKTVRSI